jgi:hypothetical protein
MLLLAGLACNAAGGADDSEATVQAIYVTITAQASAAPVLTRQAGSATSLPSLAATPTRAITPTAPESRSGNGSNLNITRCTSSVTADASDADWTSQSGVVGVPLDQNTYGASEWTGPSDLSGYMRMCWNDSGLYLFVDVTDDVHVQDQRGDTSWKGDEVEFLFDANLHGDFYKDVWDGDDYQVGLNPGDFSVLAPVPYRFHPTGGLPRGVELFAAPTGTAGNYRLEAELLLEAELGIQLTAGQRYGLCVALSDNDHPGEASQDSMVSHCSRLLVTDPTTWITITLE